MKNKFLACLLIMVCSFACIFFVACDKNKEQTQTTYSVNFYDYDGTRLGIPTSEEDDTIIYTQIIKKGESATAPAVPGREGYMFTGWSKDFENVTSNLEIVAQYVSACEVVFKNYDNSIIKTEIVAYGSDATPPEVETRAGYRFVGWIGDYRKVIADTTIVADYVEQCSVDFVNYDDSLISSQVVDKGTKAIAPNEKLIKIKPETEDGVYEFAGWDKQFDNVQSNLTIKATFKIKTYTVNFVDWNGESLSAPQTVKHGESAIAPNMTGKMYLDTKSEKKAGYRFSGFDKNFESVKSNMTINALYTKIEEPIIFVENKTYEEGTTLAKVGVYVITSKPICGLKIKLYYDNDVLTLSSLQQKSKFIDGHIQSKTKDNYIEFVWTNSSDISFANNFSQILELDFDINAYQSAGTYTIVFDETETQYSFTQNNFPQSQQVVLISGSVILTEKEGN